jgi:arabinofuranan 3-O-arabinosyltransferase
VASRRELVELREVDAVLCGAGAKDPLPLAGGEARVVAAASRLAMPTRLVLTPDAVVPGPADGSAAGSAGVAGSAGAADAVQTPIRVDGWSATRRSLHLDGYAGQRVLALRENANAGWEATAGGERLTPFVVDGWQQGWLVPAGFSGEVLLRFAPDDGYVAALGVGAILLGGVAVAALLPSRGVPAPAAVPARRRRHRLLAVVFGGAALLLVGGLAAVAVALLAAAGVVAGRALEPQLHPPDRRGLHRLRRMVGRWLPVGCFALAGWYAVTRGGHVAAAPQLAAVAAVTVLWFSVVLGPRRFPGSFQRWNGRSTA